MKASEVIVQNIVNKGVTDVFGIPGGVVIGFLESVRKNPNLKSHLLPNENSCGFAAISYARTSGKLGVVYATKGPGFTNLMTAINMAWQDSFPLLVVIGHNDGEPELIGQLGVRHTDHQNMDTVSLVQGITKFAIRIDTVSDIDKIQQAINITLDGRKGPALIDIASSVWDKEV